MVYSLLSLAGLILIVRGYAEARLDPEVLYFPPTWLKHVASLLLLPAFILFFGPYFPGRIKTATKHPQLVAVKLWAAAHLLANGSVADVVLFGSFLAWAVLERISLKRRVERPLPGAPAGAANDIILVVAGLGAYAVFALWAHAALIGVAPFA